jgi:hypothetical protein
MKCLRVLGLLTVMLSCGMAYGSNVKTDYDRSFDLGRLRTFTFRSDWRSDRRTSNTLVDKRIEDALIRDLEARGFRYQPNGPADFVVAYYAREREKVEPAVIGYGMP